MANREFVMLSESVELEGLTKLSLGSWYASEKLDGMRALWLPDTCGQELGKLPFANLDKSHAKVRTRVATGLWSRYAKPIYAPAWFTEQLPRDKFLDGELWTGRNQFQRLTSIVKDHDPGPGWLDVHFCVFDSPSPDQIYRDGRINNLQLKKNLKGVWDWCRNNLGYHYQPHSNSFDQTYASLRQIIVGDNVLLHRQRQLNWRNSTAVVEVQDFLNEVLATGGEGLILRHPSSCWEPKRKSTSLKVKPYHDAEATVVGITSGEGRLEGMIGALEVEGDVAGRRVAFKLGTGLTDSERQVQGTKFTVGTVITYRYRELTKDGIPREARFLRLWSDL